MASDGGWFKTRLGEGVAIVLSILLAFGIDAAWDEAKERSEEREVLEALRDDFRANREDVQVVLEQHLEQRADVILLAGMSRAEIAALTPDEVGRIVPALANPWTFDPRMGALDALVASGQLGLLRNRELARELSAFVNAVRDIDEDVGYMQSFSERVWEREAQLGGPWMRQEVEGTQRARVEGSSDESMFGDMSFVDEPTPADLQRLWDDELLRGLVRQTHINVAYYVAELEDMERRIEGILARLDEALAG